MVIFQIPSLISFSLEKYYHLRVVDFIDQNYLIMTSLSYLTDFHCLSITKTLVNAKLLVVGKL